VTVMTEKAWEACLRAVSGGFGANGCWVMWLYTVGEA